MNDFFDFRTAHTYSGGVIGTTDYSTVAPGNSHQQLIFYGYSSETGSLIAKITATRDADGILKVASSEEEVTPILDGETLIGVRFPGCDPHPVYDQERDGD